MARPSRKIIAAFLSLIVFFGLLLVFSPPACQQFVAWAPADRPDTWAQKIDDPVIGNFHKVTGTFYRGQQPDSNGMKRLHELGIKTVLNLRQFHNDNDELSAVNSPTQKLKPVHLRMSAFGTNDDEIIAALKVLVNPDNHPVFLHCKHGSDRTGVITAAYRIVVQGWTREAATEEMRHGGFGAHEMFDKLQAYLSSMDAEGIRKRLKESP